MRLLFVIIAALVLSACGEDPKSKKQNPMTCARQNAMFVAGYKYYWSGDNLVVYSENGDHYVLTEDEKDAGFMFDRCETFSNDNNHGGYYYHGKNKRKYYRNAKDRKTIRRKNNAPDRDRGDW